MTGRAQEFETTVSCERPLLVRLAGAILKNPDAAEEAVQEALFKAWRRLNGFRGEAHLATWLKRIVIRQCLMHMRSLRLQRTRSAEIEQLYYLTAAAGPDELWLAQEIQALVHYEISCVPRIYRNLLLRDLMIFEDGELSLAGSFAGSGLKYGAARTRRQRARLWLARRMQQHKDSHAI